MSLVYDHCMTQTQKANLGKKWSRTKLFLYSYRKKKSYKNLGFKNNVKNSKKKLKNYS